MATIPLDQIIPDATIRLTIIHGVQYLSIRDIIMHTCGRDANESNGVWRRLSDANKDILLQYVENFQFPGRGQSSQPVITITGAIKLVMVLPGETAKKNRLAMTNLLSGYSDEAPPLIEEIETFPIDDIVPGATIRFTVIDGVQYLSIRDFIMHVCDKDGDHASQTWRNLSETNKKSLRDFLANFVFPGRGAGEQPVITFPGAVQLSMFLPGENAKKNRSAMSKKLVRYFAGDPSLIKEIEDNARSDEPVAQMARASLAAEQKTISRKREFEQLEYEERVAALERMRAETEKIKADANAKKLELYASLCGPHPRIDDRARLLFKDVVMNSITGVAATGQLKITDTTTPAPAGEPSVGFITISTVASEMGYKFDTRQLMKLGVNVKSAYNSKYGEDPPKHEQFVNGAVRRVNTYQAKDRELIKHEISAFVKSEGLGF